MMGRSEPLKMLLNQRSPAEFQRNSTYYGYFGRDRAPQDRPHNAKYRRDRRISPQDRRTRRRIGATGRAAPASRAGAGKGPRAARAGAASLQVESRNRGAQLKRLQQQQQQLEKLLMELRRATEATPFDPNDPFAKLRGRLSWPVAGKLETSYGDRAAGGMRSNGIEIAADRGATVRAVHEGRVIFADWLSGRGSADHPGPWQRIPEPVRPQRAVVQAGRRHRPGRRSHCHGRRFRGPGESPGCISRSAARASR